MKKYKNIGINPKTTGKKLKLQAIERGVSYQQHCEDILEEQAKSGIITFGKTKKKEKPKKKDETEHLESTEANKKDLKESIEQLEKEEVVEVEIPNDDILITGDLSITTDEKKGAFARDHKESNIYTNGKIWEYRIYEQDELKQIHFRTKELAIKARDSKK